MVEHTFHINIGANYISMPVMPANRDPSNIFGAEINLWEFNVNTQGWESVNVVVPGKGYYLYSPKSKTVVVSGVSSIVAESDLLSVYDSLAFEQYALIGPGKDAISTTGTVIDGKIKDINNNIITTMYPGNGYWMHKGETMNKQDIINEISSRGYVDLYNINWSDGASGSFYDTSGHNRGIVCQDPHPWIWTVHIRNIETQNPPIDTSNIYIGRSSMGGSVLDWVDEVDKSWMMNKINKLSFTTTPSILVDNHYIADKILEVGNGKPIDKYAMHHSATQSTIWGWTYSTWAGPYSWQMPHLVWQGHSTKQPFGMWIENISTINPPIIAGKIHTFLEGSQYVPKIPEAAVLDAISQLPFGKPIPKARCYKGIPRSDPGHPTIKNVGDNVIMSLSCWNMGIGHGTLVFIFKKNGEVILHEERYVEMGEWQYEGGASVETSFVMPNEHIYLEFIAGHLENDTFIEDSNYKSELRPTEAPTCSEGEQRCTNYDLQECRNGNWVTIETNSTQCGYVPPVICTEGTHEVLEYCPDNVTEKRWQDCINNQWIEELQECPVCTCTNWINAECINETQRRQTRTCNPSSCDVEERIISDSSCAIQCICTDWINAECINETQRRQTRTCTPAGCDVEERVVSDASCTTEIPTCTEGEQKCIGVDLYKCINDQWVKIESNSEQCGYTPPPVSIPCPIACIAFGTPMMDFLGPIRIFRDAILSKTNIGRRFIHFYYNKITPFISPKILKMRGK